MVPLYPSKQESITYRGKLKKKYIFSDNIENAFLLSEHIKNSIENEIVHIILDILVSWLFSIFLKQELHLMTLSVQD